MSQNINNSIVSPQEVEALKEMIFKRAKERAESTERTIEQTYTGSIKNDVMEIARNSFVAPHNPFSDIVKQEIPTEKENKNSVDIGFKQQRTTNGVPDLTKELYSAKAEIYATMSEARTNLESKSTFMGALNFLNSQATIANWQRKGKSFNAIA